MSKIAVDIVLLPPDDIMDLCIELSKKAYDRGENKFLRNKKDRLPHITLLMGCMESESQGKVWRHTTEVAGQFEPLQLRITKQERDALTIEKTTRLVEFQKKLIEDVNPHFTQDCTLEHLLEDENYVWDEESRVWVNDYVRDNIGENWWPHITTHNTKKENIDLPIEFIADRIALCHMGDHGTCRKILAEVTLK